jgi:hypothetical protein
MNHMYQWLYSIIDKSGNIFRIESPYNLNCNETKVFGLKNNQLLTHHSVTLKV